MENAAYGGAICAERSAMVAAVSSGRRQFKAVAVVIRSSTHGYPCGACRQFMVEFGDIEVLVATADHLAGYRRVRLAALLPHSFTKADLDMAHK